MADTYSVVTKYRRVSLCQITSGEITSLPKITHVAFGDGGVDSNGDRIIPDENQTALKSELKRYPIDGVSYPVDTTARYVVTIPKGEMDGERISEAGLYDADSKLCAIKNMYVKQKDEGSDFIFTFDDEY